MGEKEQVGVVVQCSVVSTALGLVAVFPPLVFRLLSLPLSFSLPALLSVGLKCDQLHLSLIRIATNRLNEAVIPLNPLRRRLRRSVDSIVINKRLSFTFGCLNNTRQSEFATLDSPVNVSPNARIISHILVHIHLRARGEVKHQDTEPSLPLGRSRCFESLGDPFTLKIQNLCQDQLPHGLDNEVPDEEG